MTVTEEWPAAETAVLGACLLSPDALSDVAGVLTPADFYAPRHAAVWAAALALHERGEPADAVTVARELQASGDLARVGGGPFLHDLIANVPTTGSATWYAKIVADDATSRRLDAAGERIRQIATSDTDVDEKLSLAEQSIRALTRTQSSSRTVGELRDEFFDELEAGSVDGIVSGYTDLDLDLLHPLRPGQFVVIAGRTSTGKSVMGLDIARHTAVRLGLPVLLCSIEMSSSEVMSRLYAAESGTSLDRVQQKRPTDEDWIRLAKTCERVDKAPLHINDSPNQTAASIRAELRRMPERPSLLVVDYLQLLTTKSRQSREAEVAESTRALKLLAKDEGLPVLVLAQLNRQPATRKDGRPLLTDLRESGAIEQDADTVLLLHPVEDRAGELVVIVAKQRNGPTGQRTLCAQLHFSRFTNLGRYT